MSSKEMSEEFYQGLYLLNQEKYPEALKCFERDLENDPAIYRSINNMGFCKLKIGIAKGNKEMIQEAIENFNDAISLAKKENNLEDFPNVVRGNLELAKKELEKLIKEE